MSTLQTNGKSGTLRMHAEELLMDFDARGPHLQGCLAGRCTQPLGRPLWQHSPSAAVAVVPLPHLQPHLQCPMRFCSTHEHMLC